jgi:TonB family protein
VLEVVIKKDGSVDVLRVVRAAGYGLDENAIAALKQWVFRPGSKNGTPVDVAINVEVNFNLEKGPPPAAPPALNGFPTLRINSPQYAN